VTQSRIGAMFNNHVTAHVPQSAAVKNF